MTISRGAALRLARARRVNECDHVVLAHRPHGVAHVYVGPLTPSAGFVPRARRTVCKTRTRRLTVCVSPAALTPSQRRLCRRCVAVLLSWGQQDRHHLVTREDWLREFGDLTAFDLAVDAYMAETPAEVERVAFLALLVVGFPACARDAVVSPTGKTTRPLDAYVSRARNRVGGQRPEEIARAEIHDIASANAAEERRAAARLTRKEREDAIERLGFINATS